MILATFFGENICKTNSNLPEHINYHGINKRDIPAFDRYHTVVPGSSFVNQ
jgi:hypothetical protein